MSKNNQHVNTQIVLWEDKYWSKFMTSARFLTTNTWTSYNESTTSIEIPNNATEITFWATSDIKISEKSDMSTYFVIPSDVMYTEWIFNMEYIYISKNEIDGVIYYKFNEAN